MPLIRYAKDKYGNIWRQMLDPAKWIAVYPDNFVGQHGLMRAPDPLWTKQLEGSYSPIKYWMEA